MMIEAGFLAGLIIIGSMSVGVLAIVGFCLQVMFNRKVQCSSDLELGIDKLAEKQSTHKGLKRYPSSLSFNESTGRLPPPPPLSPPPPPANSSLAESTQFPNTSFSYLENSNYDSLMEMPTSSGQTTLPRIIVTSDFSSMSSPYLQGQILAEYHHTKLNRHISPTIQEENEDITTLESSVASSSVNLKSTSTMDYIHHDLNVPDSDTTQTVTSSQGVTVSSTLSESSTYPPPVTTAKPLSEDIKK